LGAPLTHVDNHERGKISKTDVCDIGSSQAQGLKDEIIDKLLE